MATYSEINWSIFKSIKSKGYLVLAINFIKNRHKLIFKKIKFTIRKK